MSKTEKIVELAKNKSLEKEEMVLNVIEKMKVLGEKITFYSVYNKASVSKSFVYNNERIRNIIEKEREAKVEQKEETKDNIILIHKKKIIELQKELKRENYKEKYYNLLEENKKIKEELNIVYSKLY